MSHIISFWHQCLQHGSKDTFHIVLKVTTVIKPDLEAIFPSHPCSSGKVRKKLFISYFNVASIAGEAINSIIIIGPLSAIMGGHECSRNLLRQFFCYTNVVYVLLKMNNTPTLSKYPSLPKTTK